MEKEKDMTGKVRVMEVTVVGRVKMNLDMFDEGVKYTEWDMLNDNDILDFLGNFDDIISIKKETVGVEDFEYKE